VRERLKCETQLLSERTAKFISIALEASLSFDSRLLLLKLPSKRFGVARGASSRVCVPESLYYPIIYGFHSK
jgi:hypothetical protein